MDVLIFGAPWCASCKVLKAEIKGQEFPGYQIKHVDLSENPDLGNQYGIRSLPSIVIPDRMIIRNGITTLRQLQALLQQAA